MNPLGYWIRRRTREGVVMSLLNPPPPDQAYVVFLTYDTERDFQYNSTPYLAFAYICGGHSSRYGQLVHKML